MLQVKTFLAKSLCNHIPGPFITVVSDFNIHTDIIIFSFHESIKGAAVADQPFQ